MFRFKAFMKKALALIMIITVVLSPNTTNLVYVKNILVESFALSNDKNDIYFESGSESIDNVIIDKDDGEEEVKGKLLGATSQYIDWAICCEKIKNKIGNSCSSLSIVRDAHNEATLIADFGDYCIKYDGDVVYIISKNYEYLKLRNSDAKEMFAKECFDNIRTINLKVLDTSEVTDMSSMFAGRGKLSTLELGSFLNTELVTNMSSMFSSCSSLVLLDLGSFFDTGNVTDMSSMFSGCSSLKALYLQSKFDTEKVENMSKMFANCSALPILHIGGKFITKNVTDMSLMFSNCSSLYSLDLENFFDTVKVRNMSSMFSGCGSLISLNLGFNFYTSRVKDMSSMFADCSSLTSLSLGNHFDTSYVTDMSSMFAGCSSLTSLSLGNDFNTKSVEDMSKMFSGCSSLTSLSLGNYFGTNKVTDMSSMFSGCSSLTSHDLGDKFYTSRVKDMSSMFADCSSLTSLSLGNYFDTSKVKNMSSMFVDCSSLTSLDLGNEFNTSSVEDMSSMFSKCSSLTSLSLGNYFDTSYVTDMSNMFFDCAALIELDLGYKFDTKNVTDMNRMFAYCMALETLKLGNEFNTENVTNMESMFLNCFKLKDLDLGDDFDTKKVTNMSSMFSDCKSLTELNLTNKFDTTNVKRMPYMFARCEKLSVLDLGNSFNTSNVEDMENMFFNCSSLASLDLGNKFNTSNVKSMQNMFEKCKTLEKLDLGENFVTSNVTDMTSMFSDCNKMTELKLGSKFDTSKVIKMGSMFSNCSSLQILKFGDYFDTSKVKEMDEMFSGCSSLETIKIDYIFDTSEVVQSTNMFAGCTKLRGGKGTEWSIDYIDKEYARVDTNFARGYFTYDYFIDYRLNGGSFYPSTFVPAEIIYKDKVTVLPITNNLMKENAIFEGWYDNEELYGSPIVELSEDFLESITVYAKWLYRVQFDTNGGSKIDNAYVIQNNILKKPTDPIKDGYVFIDWYKDGGYTELYDFNEPVTKTFTLYAKFLKDSEICVITFNSNGGTNVATQKVGKGQKINKPTEPIRTSYVFKYWCEDAQLKREYDFTKTVSGNMTLYAKWELDTEYTIKFDARGLAENPMVQKVQAGEKVTNPGNLSATGYEFKYWYYDNIDEGYDFNKNVNTDMILKALWEEKVYNINYELNGGEFIDEGAVQRTRKYTEGVTLPYDNVQNGDLYLWGWYTDSSFSEEKNISYINKNTASDITVYAKWITSPVYVVSFDTGGKSASIANQLILEGGKAVEPETPVAVGFNFIGWYKEGESNKFDFSQAITESVVLKAKWEELEYEIKYVLNGGVLRDGLDTIVQRKYTETIELPTWRDITNGKLHFDGWYENEKYEGDIVVVVVGNKEENAKNKTFYAKWTNETKWYVTFDLQGHGENEIEPQQVLDGQMAKAPNVPTADGWQFINWYISNKDVKFDFSKTPITGNIVLKANWEEKIYKIDYELNGGAFVSGYKAPTSRMWSESIELPTSDKIKNGSKYFAGWYTSKDFSGQSISYIKNGEKDKVVYAKWGDSKLYKVSFIMNGKGEIINSQYVEEGGKVVKPENPKEVGYEFINWYEDAKLENKYEFSKEVRKDINLYAKWEEKTYKITYDLAGGKFKNENIVKKERKWTESVLLPDATNVEKAGLYFGGWYLNSSCKGEQVSRINEKTDENVVVYAKWTTNPIYIVSFDTMGHGKSIAPQMVEKDGKAIKPKDVLSDVGYEFKYWYNVDEKVAFDFNTKITNSIVLKAKWEEKEYNIYYEMGGGSWIEGYEVVSKRKYTEKVVLPTSSKIKKNKSSFLGWYDSKAYTNQVTEIKSKTDSDVVIYAKWKGKSSGGGGGGGGGGGSGIAPKIVYDPLKSQAVSCKERTIDVDVANEDAEWIYNVSSNTWSLNVDRRGFIKNGEKVLASESFYKVDGKIYYFDISWNMVTGWCKDMNNNYYLFEWEKNGSEGAMVTGWRMVNGNNYYFGLDGKLLTYTITPDGYLVDADGVRVTNVEDAKVLDSGMINNSNGIIENKGPQVR